MGKKEDGRVHEEDGRVQGGSGCCWQVEATLRLCSGGNPRSLFRDFGPRICVFSRLQWQMAKPLREADIPSGWTRTLSHEFGIRLDISSPTIEVTLVQRLCTRFVKGPCQSVSGHSSTDLSTNHHKYFVVCSILKDTIAYSLTK